MSVAFPAAARRTQRINPFRVMAVLERARELAAAGIDVVHLEVGEPDFPTAEPIIAAGIKALQQGHTAYTAAAGMPALRERIAAWYQERYRVVLDPKRVFVTPGASGALVLVAHLLLDPGARVLMLDPGYPCNRNYVTMVGADPVLLPPATPGAVAPSAQQLTASLAQGGVNGLWLASPANPTGAVLGLNELQTLAQWCAEHQVHWLVDEIYHGLDYVGGLPSALEVAPDAIVVNSFSKFFGMTGWRIGWVVVPEALIELAQVLAQNLFIAAPTPAQYAALRAFDPDVLELLEQRREAFRQRRDFLVSALQDLGLPLPWRADGAFYLYADISRHADSSEAFCRDLLERHAVALTPGTDFGVAEAARYVRFAFTTAIPRLEVAYERLRRAL